MRTRVLFLTLVFLISVTPFGFAGIITPISASVSMTANADAGCGNVTVTDSDSWGTLLSNLSAGVTDTAHCTHPTRNLDVRGAVQATWSNNTRKGTISFNRLGWNANNNVTSGTANVNTGVNYSYTFTPTTDILLTLAYDTSWTGDLNGFGLNGFFVTLTNNWSTGIGINATGVLTAVLYPGTNYTLQISNGANILGNIAGVSEHLNGDFNFLAIPAPEPGTMLMLGTGLIGMAGTLRRRLTR